MPGAIRQLLMQLVVELLRNSHFLLAAKASPKARARKRGSLPKERAEMPTPLKRDPFHQEPLHSLVDLRRASFVERLDIWRHNAPMGHRLRKEIHRRLHPLRGLRLLTR